MDNITVQQYTKFYDWERRRERCSERLRVQVGFGLGIENLSTYAIRRERKRGLEPFTTGTTIGLASVLFTRIVEAAAEKVSVHSIDLSQETAELRSNDRLFRL